ncbi:hypothetical protein AI2884V1_0254 [Serratia marcescens]|nr:hypothetical protein AI2872V1_0254 [Serratia marcescens]CAF2639094.1 hypothetical protein AI2884V1_0254 [Serratia marcescens]CAH5029664.1 hypothetical protein AI2872V1_0254 [Serratia marcescens]CAH5061484.1 hypothetical protein AI2884V1_0254 [Serratia marcescens]
MAGFFAFWVRTLHRTAFDYSAKGLTLRASAEALFNAAQTPVVRPVALFRRTRLWRFFAFWDTDSPSNCVRLFGLSFPRRNQPNQCQYARFSDQHQIEMSGESDINKPKDQEDRQRNRPSEHKEPGIAKPPGAKQQRQHDRQQPERQIQNQPQVRGDDIGERGVIDDGNR